MLVHEEKSWEVIIERGGFLRCRPSRWAQSCCLVRRCSGGVRLCSRDTFHAGGLGVLKSDALCGGMFEVGIPLEGERHIDLAEQLLTVGVDEINDVVGLRGILDTLRGNADGSRRSVVDHEDFVLRSVEFKHGFERLRVARAAFVVDRQVSRAASDRTQGAVLDAPLADP